MKRVSPILIRLFDEEGKAEIYLSAMEKLDFTHFSRKSWDLLRKLRPAQLAFSNSTVTAKAISNNLFKTSNKKKS